MTAKAITIENRAGPYTVDDVLELFPEDRRVGAEPPSDPLVLDAPELLAVVGSTDLPCPITLDPADLLR